MKIGLFIISIFFLFSCKKEVENGENQDINHGGYDPNERYIKIDIHSLNDLDTLKNSDFLNIKGEISANFMMHGYSLSISKSDEALFESNQHIHGDYFELDYSWEHDFEQSQWIKVKILAVGNHYGTLENEEEWEIFVEV